MKSTIAKKVEEVSPKTRIIKNRSLHNIFQTTDATFLEISLPGYTKKDIEIKIEKDKLKVSNVNVVADKSLDAKYVSKGFEKAAFEDTFILPEDINIEKIKAEMEAGVLVITLPLKEELNINKVIKIK